MNKIITALITAALASSPALAADTERRLNRLEDEVARLQERVWQLERLLRRHNRSDAGNHVYVCRINAFTETYEAESANQGQAKREAQKACLREQNELFCRPEKIHCHRY